MKKDIFTTSVTRLVIMAASLAQGVLVARYLLDEGKGIISLYVVALNLTLALGDMGGKQSFAFFMTKRGMELREAWRYIRVSLSLAIVFEAFLLLSVLLSRDMMGRRTIVAYLMAIMVFRLYSSYSYSFALALRKIQLINLCHVVTQVVTLSFVIVFIVVLDGGEEWFFAGTLAGATATCAILSIWRYRHLESLSVATEVAPFDWQRWRTISVKGFSYAIPLFIMGLNYRLDIFILDYYENEGVVGVYSQGASLAQLLWLFPEVLALVIFSHSLNSSEEKKFAVQLIQNLWKLMKVLGLVLLPIGAAAFYLIPVIYGPAFAQSSWVFLIILPGVYLMVLYKSLNGDLAARGFPQIAGYVFFPAVVINVVLNIILIPKYSAVGAAIASSISYTIAALVYLFIYRRMTSKLVD